MRCGLSWKKKDKKCTDEKREEGEAGSIWDHIAIDPTSKLVVSMVQGPRRDQKTSDLLVADFADRTKGMPPELVTTDEHTAYEACGCEHHTRGRHREYVGRRPGIFTLFWNDQHLICRALQWDCPSLQCPKTAENVIVFKAVRRA